MGTFNTWFQKPLPGWPWFQQRSWWNGLAKWYALVESSPFCCRVGVAFVLCLWRCPLHHFWRECLPFFTCDWQLAFVGADIHYFLLFSVTFQHVLFITMTFWCLCHYNLLLESEKRHLEVCNDTYNVTLLLSAPELFHCGFESLFQKQQGRKVSFWWHVVNRSETHTWLYLNDSEGVEVST